MTSVVEGERECAGCGRNEIEVTLFRYIYAAINPGSIALRKKSQYLIR
jgi:hypothetical protein